MSLNLLVIQPNLRLIVSVSLALSILFGQPVALTKSAPPDKVCTTYSVAVALAPGQPATYQIAGSLCSRGDPAGKTIQVLVHGVTLSHVYWDFPYQPERYSYVNALTAAGYATFNLDRIGIGDSDHPAALAVTIDSNAFVIHQVIQQLRAGTLGGIPFAKIVLVGHSLGTIISMTEASRYDDVDGIIGTGFLHVSGSPSLETFSASLIPTLLDQKFSHANLPLGYFTTRAGTRGIFYNAADTDPQVAALDEATKQTSTQGELLTFAEWFNPILTRMIHVPIFLTVGERDQLFCNLLTPCANPAAIIGRERLFYSTQGTCLEAFVLATSGHNLNYELNAQDFYVAAQNWTDRYIGQTSAAPPTICS